MHLATSLGVRVLPGLYVGNYRDSKDSLQLERFEITHIVAIHDTPRKLHLDKHYLCVMASDTPDQNLTQYFPLCNDFIHAARLRGGHVLIHWFISWAQIRPPPPAFSYSPKTAANSSSSSSSVLSSEPNQTDQTQKACGERREYHLVWIAGDGESNPRQLYRDDPLSYRSPKESGCENQRKMVDIWMDWPVFMEVPVVPSLAGMSRSVTVAVAYIMSVTTLNWKEALKVVRVGRSVANPNFGFQKQLQEFEAFKLLEERRRMKERFPSLLLANQDEEQCRLMLHSYQSLILSRDLCEGDCSLGQTCPTGLCRSPSKR
uniref:Tyrosine-protein phosphatase domain-containing protein n=1 Tax=Timema shepardi TaxID=629360 RepID=A0A7R9FVV1_TIMSH|nr:unnamed protein product [Timema shepardi]